MESLPEHLGGSSEYSHVAWIQACVNSTQGQQKGDCMDNLFHSYTLEQNPVSDGLNSNCSPQTVTDNTQQQHNHYLENRTSNFHADPSSLGNLQNWNGSVVTVNYDGADIDSSVNTNGRKPPPQSETPPDTPLHKHASEELAVPPLPQKSRPLPSVMEMSIHLPEDGGLHIQELVQHIKRKKKKGIYQEYEEIRKEPPSGTFDYSKKPYNQIKNRYSDVLCLDQSRVKLNLVDDDDDDETSDYINASFMDGYKRKNAYIAAQGPLPKTFVDFWRMVWEQKVLIIVMTTRVVERGRIKCGQYWPLEVGQTEEYGQFLIRNIHIEMFQDFKLSHLEVYNKETGESRDVAHYLYMSWPDFGVPKSASAMLDFRSQVKQHQEAALQAFGSQWTGPPGGPPIVVHCSAGIGRTGTFCTLDICLSRLEDIGTVDVNQTVKRMRTQRAFSIQTWDQYYFCYMAVLEYAQRKGLLAPVEWSDSDLETDNAQLHVDMSHSIADGHDLAWCPGWWHLKQVAGKEGAEVKYLSSCCYGNGPGSATTPAGGLGPGPSDGGAERGGGTRLFHCAGPDYSCWRGDKWEEPERPVPEKEEPGRPAPEWEEPERPQPKRGESVRPQPKRGVSASIA
ncbi:UNVERIFIED_CONTAM: hypothetical protein FKN15_025199 [Acipenser sinensis]